MYSLDDFILDEFRISATGHVEVIFFNSFLIDRLKQWKVCQFIFLHNVCSMSIHDLSDVLGFIHFNLH